MRKFEGERDEFQTALVTGTEETESETLEKLKSPVSQQISLKVSDEKVNDKTTIVLKDMDGMKSC